MGSSLIKSIYTDRGMKRPQWLFESYKAEKKDCRPSFPKIHI